MFYSKIETVFNTCNGSGIHFMIGVKGRQEFEPHLRFVFITRNRLLPWCIYAQTRRAPTLMPALCRAQTDRLSPEKPSHINAVSTWIMFDGIKSGHPTYRFFRAQIKRIYGFLKAKNSNTENSLASRSLPYAIGRSQTRLQQLYNTRLYPRCASILILSRP